MLTADAKRETRAQREAFERVRRAEYQYAAALRKVCRHIGDIIRGVAPNVNELTDEQIAELTAILRRYSVLIQPWAKSVARRMLFEVARRNEKAWKLRTEAMGRDIRKEIYTTPIGAIIQASMDRQVHLITSLPLDAAERVHALALGNLYTGGRASVIAGEVGERLREQGFDPDRLKARAMLIARTEVARASTEITKARAESIGSTHFVWRTVQDEVVRPSIFLPANQFARLNTFAKGSHRKLNGTIHRWDDPPISGPNGERSLPGAIYNCRCVTSETKVSLLNGCRKIWRFHYDGPLVVFTLDDGSTIEATPNHPIMTRYGWKPAGLLDQGDEVLQDLNAVEYHKDEPVATFGEVFEALALVGLQRRVCQQGAVFDFHGDVPHGDVDEVSPDWPLPFESHTGSLHEVGQFAHAGAKSWIDGVGVTRGGGDQVPRPFVSGSCDVFDPLFRSTFGSENLVGSLPVAKRHGVSDKQISDCHGGHTIFGCDGWRAGPALVFGDDIGFWQVESVPPPGRPASDDNAPGFQLLAEDIGVHADFSAGINEVNPRFHKFLCVVDKRFRDFSDHVYTMQSETGYYSIGDAMVVSKNCTAEPIIPDVLE